MPQLQSPEVAVGATVGVVELLEVVGYRGVAAGADLETRGIALTDWVVPHAAKRRTAILEEVYAIAAKARRRKVRRLIAAYYPKHFAGGIMTTRFLPSNA
jgi:hypothetical protein